MESPIDERYRLLLLEHYLDNAVEAPFYGVIKKWVFVCPFCGPLGSTASKKKHRKAALLWNAAQHSWVFSCAKKGSIICTRGLTLGNLISALNPALGEAYKKDRWHSGTTGKGHNCGVPQSVVGVSTAGGEHGVWFNQVFMSTVKRVGVVAMALLAYALAACSPQAYQVNPNPDVTKKGEQVPESEQEGYMRIVGDLRWDELPNKEAWQKRFPGCFNDGGKGQGLYSKFNDGNYRPTGNMPSACQIEVGGFRLAPLSVSTSIDSASFSIQLVQFMITEASQQITLSEAIKKKYEETYLTPSYTTYNLVAGPSAPWFCSKYTCLLPGYLLWAGPTPSVVSELNTAGVDDSSL